MNPAGLDVKWWKDEPPIKVWEVNGITCAIGPGLMGLNGYVRLPEGHPWRRKHLQDDDYELVSVHGGITFGPHDTGWIGFDTAHAGDWWTDEEIASLPGTEELLARREEMREILGSEPDEPRDRQWTVGALRVAIMDLAQQVKWAMR